MPKSINSSVASKTRPEWRSRSFRVSGQILCSLRLARGWTQVEAAERAGISERLIRMAEADGKLGFRSIAILAQLYSAPEAPLSPDALMKDSLDDPPDSAQEAAETEIIVRRWFAELWNFGALEVLDEFAAPGCVLHSRGERLRGRAAVCRFVRAMRGSWGDFKCIARRPTVFGNIAVAKWRVQLRCSPSSTAGSREKQADLHGSTWFRVADGLLHEVWRYCEFPPTSSETRRAAKR